jgi:hypothetical protein
MKKYGTWYTYPNSFINKDLICTTPVPWWKELKNKNKLMWYTPGTYYLIDIQLLISPVPCTTHFMNGKKIKKSTMNINSKIKE